MSAPRFSIVVVGDGAVGKSAMTLRFLRDQYDPTIEDSYCKHIEVDGQEYTLDIIDTAGQQEYRGHWNDQFMRAGDGFICVYSIASMGSFQELIEFRNQIWHAKESEDVPIVIAANKSDLSEEREVDTEIGREFARLSDAFYIETSAKTGYHVHEMVNELVRDIVRKRQRDGDADLRDENETLDADRAHSKNDGALTMATNEYVKSSKPARMLDGEDTVAQEERCCCSIM
ncbi:Ras GTPase [Haplosporangium sp. Z 11]|nr:Ras GTPase [Haplosporangium sp. Z 11]